MATKIDDSVKMRLRVILEKSGLTSHAYAQSVHIDPSAFAKKLKGSLPVTNNDLDKLEKFGKISKDWLLTGEGSMLSEPSTPSPRSAVPVYDVDVTCGLTEPRTYADMPLEGYIDIPSISKDAIIVKSHGDSMLPTVHDGDYVAIRRIDTWDYIMFGNIYVVELPDYRAMKRIRKGSDEAHVVLRSDNDDYDDVEVPKADIRSLWVVENIISIKKLF